MAIITCVVVAVKNWSEELEKTIKDDYGPRGTAGRVEVDQIDNSQANGICAKYNLAIEKIISLYGSRKDEPSFWGISNYSWVVFSHDDVLIKTSHANLNLAFNQVAAKGADIVCAAGTTQIPPLDPGYWWKGLTEAGFRGSGSVIHRTPGTDDILHIESYGPYPQQVAAFDGLWFAVRLSTLLNQPKLRFEDSLPGYHYYDVDFAATARSLDLSLWTMDIQLLHNKWGRGMEDPAFEQHQKLFIDKWSKQKHLYYRGAPPQQNISFIDSTSAFK